MAILFLRGGVTKKLYETVVTKIPTEPTPVIITTDRKRERATRFIWKVRGVATGNGVSWKLGEVKAFPRNAKAKEFWGNAMDKRVLGNWRSKSICQKL